MVKLPVPRNGIDWFMVGYIAFCVVLCLAAIILGG